MDFIKEKNVKPSFKLWFEIGGDYVFGQGAYNLLREIKKRKSISAAAKATNMSYRYAWNIIKEIEKHLDDKIIESYKGGIRGGGSELTMAGNSLINCYKKLKFKMVKVCKL